MSDELLLLLLFTWFYLVRTHQTASNQVWPYGYVELVHKEGIFVERSLLLLLSFRPTIRFYSIGLFYAAL